MSISLPLDAFDDLSIEGDRYGLSIYCRQCDDNLAWIEYQTSTILTLANLIFTAEIHLKSHDPKRGTDLP